MRATLALNGLSNEISICKTKISQYQITAYWENNVVPHLYGLVNILLQDYGDQKMLCEVSRINFRLLLESFKPESTLFHSMRVNGKP